MTELLKPDHLRQIALVLDRPGKVRGKLIPVLQWSMNSETGRPAGSWVLAEDRDDTRQTSGRGPYSASAAPTQAVSVHNPNNTSRARTVSAGTGASSAIACPPFSVSAVTGR